MRTLRVGLYGGPGSGKSTTRALVFGTLKQRGVEIEEIPEYAKEMVWEERWQALKFQPATIAKQMWRERRVEDKVEVSITDTSTLLALIYGREENGVTPKFREWVLDDYRRAWRLDFFLDRDPSQAYQANGRMQTAEQAAQNDKEILDLLRSEKLSFQRVTIDSKGNSHIDKIARRIQNKLATAEIERQILNREARISDCL